MRGFGALMIKQIFQIILLIGIFIISSFIGLNLAHQAAVAGQQSQMMREKAVDELYLAGSILDAGAMSAGAVPRLAYADKYGVMEKSLEDIASRGSGVISIGFYDLERHYQYVLNPRAMPAASVIKLYIMIEAFRQERDGIIDLQEEYVLMEEDKTEGSGITAYYPDGTSFSLNELVELMIIDSDNTAANILIERLGIDNINQTIENAGCMNTQLKWKLMTDKILIEDDDNPVAVQDLILVLRSMHEGQLVSPDYDRKMMGIMKRQHYRSRIPAGLPSGTAVANKTGTLSWVVNDTAIVFTDQGDYILCVLNSSPASQAEAEEMIVGVSRITYRAFVNPVKTESILDGR